MHGTWVSSLVWEDSHMPGNKQVHIPQLPSPLCRAHELQLLKPAHALDPTIFTLHWRPSGAKNKSIYLFFKKATKYTTTVRYKMLNLERAWSLLVQKWVLEVCSLCCSVAKLRPTLCDPMDYSTPGFPVLHHLPLLAQTHVYWVSDAIQPSHPLSPLSPSAFNLSQHQGPLCPLLYFGMFSLYPLHGKFL